MIYGLLMLFACSVAGIATGVVVAWHAPGSIKQRMVTAALLGLLTGQGALVLVRWLVNRS